MSGPATGTGGLLLVHAHPDDESITTGGTIAHYRRRGIPVTVVTCTLGEEGEVIGEQWAQLTAEHADQLGGYRILELTRALAALDAAQTYQRIEAFVQRVVERGGDVPVG
uniref:PIG-L family deacetylase n=1 Tax=Nocardia cyriacigeorgica TaxID=135487 RepID=UPI002458AB60